MNKLIHQDDEYWIQKGDIEENTISNDDLIDELSKEIKEILDGDAGKVKKWNEMK